MCRTLISSKKLVRWDKFVTLLMFASCIDGFMLTVISLQKKRTLNVLQMLDINVIFVVLNHKVSYQSLPPVLWHLRHVGASLSILSVACLLMLLAHLVRSFITNITLDYPRRKLYFSTVGNVRAPDRRIGRGRRIFVYSCSHADRRNNWF